MGAKLFSIRMRAAGPDGTHISGAEDLVRASDLAGRAAQYLARAMSHPRGEPASVTITVERLVAAPMKIAALPVRTVGIGRESEAGGAVIALLTAAGVGARAARAGLRLVMSGPGMRGAAIMLATTGRRLEPDRERGIRASMLGIAPGALKTLRARLAARGLDRPQVREALVIASKIAACESVVAELCVSDDPDYATGYVASSALGYVRVPHIKPAGSMAGGRVIFVREPDVRGLIAHAEAAPVLVCRASAVSAPEELERILWR